MTIDGVYVFLGRRRRILTFFAQDHMERFWSNSIFKYLRVEPEDHYFLLTEPVCADFTLSPGNVPAMVPDCSSV